MLEEMVSNTVTKHKNLGQWRFLWKTITISMTTDDNDTRQPTLRGLADRGLTGWAQEQATFLSNHSYAKYPDHFSSHVTINK